MYSYFQKNDLTSFKRRLTEAKQCIALFEKLTKPEKEKAIAYWVSSVIDYHRAFSVAFRTDTVTNGYSIDALSKVDLSKIDLIYFFENKPLVFHTGTHFLEILYNIEESSSNKKSINNEVLSWPRKLAEYSFNPGWLDFNDYFSFQPELSQQSDLFCTWSKGEMKEKDRPTWKNLIIK